jgi:MerR family transcriptional regulator, light-induced transcriptional regulator
MRGDPIPRSAPREDQHRRDVECIKQAIDDEVIPRLALRHRTEQTPARAVSLRQPDGGHDTSAVDVERFLDHVLAGHSAQAELAVAMLRQSGWSVEQVFLDLLKPAASRIGELWCDDRVDFALATVALGHLQRMMRELSPAFAAEAEAAPHAHRALFVQAHGEQHSFGLSMLAEFFRRAGWDVVGGVGGPVHDPVERVRREWIDMIGFSIGSEPHLEELQAVIVGVRASSLNRHVVVMVGGPLFACQPELLVRAAADGAAIDARQALALAERLVAERQRKQP